MYSTNGSILAITTLVFAGPTALGAQGIVSPFDGSVGKAVFETQFDALSFAESGGAYAALTRVEGALVSRVLLKPEDKSNLEVFRSYQGELRASGFTILHAATPADKNPQTMIRELYRAPHNDLKARSYEATDEPMSGADLNYISTFGQYYLAARRRQGGTTLYVGLVLSRERNLYLIDELTTAAMETGTVTLNLDMMRSAIEETGKIAVYDIHFATGSSAIEPASADALAVIADFLGESEAGYYIVGHTDDTGTLEGNLALSAQRATAVRAALVSDFGVSADRLEASGVGPLAPVSNNTGDAGRALNRRVEIVQRLEND